MVASRILVVCTHDHDAAVGEYHVRLSRLVIAKEPTASSIHVVATCRPRCLQNFRRAYVPAELRRYSGVGKTAEPGLSRRTGY